MGRRVPHNPEGSITGKGIDWKYGEKSKDPYQVEHDDMQAAIRKGTEYNEADNGAMSSMTSILGRLCVYSGKEITWDEAFNSNVSLSPKKYTWDARASGESRREWRLSNRRARSDKSPVRTPVTTTERARRGCLGELFFLKPD